MARKARSGGILVALISLVFLLIYYTVLLIYKIIAAIFYAVSIYRSGYKAKSGNGFFETYFNKGNFGEYTLYRKIIKLFGKQYVYTNMYLDSKNTEKTELDVVALSPHGIYVFEVKNYSGYIFGTYSDKYWTQTLNRFVKNKFYNPLRQNYGHKKAIEAYLEVNEEHIIPIVNFTNKSKLKNLTLKEDSIVLQTNNTLKLIKYNTRIKPLVFNKQQLDEFATKLILVSNMENDVKQRHIESVKNHVIN